jgi:hypothetical protein
MAVTGTASTPRVCLLSSRKKKNFNVPVCILVSFAHIGSATGKGIWTLMSAHGHFQPHRKM